jgi:uncharacterized protein (DUF1697 family)
VRVIHGSIDESARWVALVRAVNLGRSRRVSMADLRQLMESIGLRDVTTVLQSGNGLFTANGEEAGVLEERLEAAFAERFGLRTRVLVRSAAELSAVITANPLPLATAEPARFHVVFLAGQPSPEAMAAARAAEFPPDEFHFGDRAIYVWYRGGILQSKLTPVLSEKRLGVAGTARNWNTVMRLAHLAQG